VAADREGLDQLVVRQDLSVQHLRLRSIAVDDAQKPVQVDLVLELPEIPVERSHQPIRTAGAKLARVEGNPYRGDSRLHALRGELVLLEHSRERGVARDDRFDGFGFNRKHAIDTLPRRRRNLANARDRDKRDREVQNL
jgi:hypothetical protein